MNNHHQKSLLRLYQVLGDLNARPPIPPLVPVKKSTWYAGIKSGRFPKSVELKDGRTKFWRSEDISALIDSAE